MKPSKDFSVEIIEKLTEKLLLNFNITQVHAFKQWYKNRYLNKEYAHMQALLPSLSYFEVRKCANGTLAIIMSTQISESKPFKEFYSLLIFNQKGAFSRFEFDESFISGTITGDKLFETVLDSSVCIFSC